MSAEKNIVRRSKFRRECWSWEEDCAPPWTDGGEPCTRAIDAGEYYMSSTIFPGHDSGFADGGFERRIKWVGNEITWERVLVPGRPITSTFCLPCACRWSNLKDAVPEILRAST